MKVSPSTQINNYFTRLNVIFNFFFFSFNDYSQSFEILILYYYIIIILVGGRDPDPKIPLPSLHH